MIVPEIAMLLLLKFKAAWDRNYDLNIENNSETDYLTEKFRKDCGDIVSLLHSDSFYFARIDWLSSVLSNFNFFKDFIAQGIVENNSTYERISKAGTKDIIQKFLSLI
ncbi:MAG: hypothetical protein M1535_05975 [Candidatus Thermoplasmatota archaeon]|nr:hypothetical protein [Candidatus Thermoplasmatota archaeon]